jgi:antitoxin CptB
MIKEPEIIRKKLLFRAWHRGTKEMDLILGPYSKENLHNMNFKELLKFQDFLNLSDPDLYKWIISGDKSYPEEYKDIIKDVILSKSS